jgi:hypothetical protein
VAALGGATRADVHVLVRQRSDALASVTVSVPLFAPGDGDGADRAELCAHANARCASGPAVLRVDWAVDRAAAENGQSPAQPSVQLPPGLESLRAGTAFPQWGGDVYSYAEGCRERLTETFAKRLGAFEALAQAGCVLEHDAVAYACATLLLDVAGNPCLVDVDLGATPPAVVVRRVGAGAAVAAAVDPELVRYSPTWAPARVAESVLAAAWACGAGLDGPTG